MFEGNRREYPVALAAGPEHGEQGMQDAIRWLLIRLRELGGQPYIYAPGVANVRDHRLLQALAKTPGVATGTWKSRAAWAGGPVLAAWPTRDKLGEIADDPRTRALVVVPWAAGEVEAWVAAVAPERLGPAQAEVTTPPLKSVVAEGLKHLTLVVNHANNLAGSMDKRDAIAVLRMLKKGGYPLPPRRSTPGPWRTDGLPVARNDFGNSPKSSRTESPSGEARTRPFGPTHLWGGSI